VQSSQAQNIARAVLDRAQRSEPHMPVSDRCVISALLALAKKQNIKVQFYGVDDELHKQPLDPEGVKRVLDGGEVKVEQRKLL
jgi:hypothetical protein